MYIVPKNDLNYSQAMLDAILSRRRLTFNPYTVSDAQLIEKIMKVRWGCDLDITQMVILKFTKLRSVKDLRKFDGIFMTVGESVDEVFVSTGSLSHGVTAIDSNRKERTFYGSRPLYTDRDVEKLVGKTVFVSRIIRGTNMRGHYKVAYRMHRLSGKLAKDASIIREAICAAKIEMLTRVINYPESPYHLSCSKGFFKYESRIQRAISIIRRFPESPVPSDFTT